MCKLYHLRSATVGWAVAVLVSCAPAAYATDIENVRTLLNAERYDEAVELLVREVDENPAHEAARVLLAEAYEKADRTDEAMETWNALLTLSRNETNLHRGRRALSRLRRLELDQTGLPPKGDRDDPFIIAMPETDWTGLDEAEDSGYLPPILPPPRAFEVPPFPYETQHFTVYTANERFSKVIGERVEVYLEFMTERLFGGRSWAVRFPILVYSTEQDYTQHGGPAGSAGVTFSSISGRTEAILLYQGAPPERSGSGGSRGSGGRDGGKLWMYGVESVLPHELTHAIVNEFFAGRRAPQWLQEAIAGRFEQTRDHYGEAARLARRVVAGEYFRMRDLFEQEGYPARISLFYEQSAAVVLYLFETGPETMHVFLSELAAGHDHDVALAAALGIPEASAVEEFERRWVEWMKRRYIDDLDTGSDTADVRKADKSDHPIFQPWVDELDTYANVGEWREIDLGSLDAFAGIGDSKKDWEVSGGRLRCTVSGEDSRGILGIRMNETAPATVSCRVKWSPSATDVGEQIRWFGFTQLDSDLNDTRVEAVAALRANTEYEVMCVWSDDLAVYIVEKDGTGVCHGRYPAFRVGGDVPDIDHPLALVAQGSVYVWDLKIAPIKEFSDKPVVAPKKETAVQRTDQDDPQKRQTRRRPRQGPMGPLGP